MSSRAERCPVSKAILARLALEGVRRVYGIPGSPLTGLHVALSESPISHVLAKHECGAAFMAYGEASITRELAVCVVTSGPGGTNALTGAAAAMEDHLPVLLITAQVARSQFGRGAIQDSSAQGADLVSMYRAVTKWSDMPPSGEMVLPYLDRAIRIARDGCPGPVHLSLPADLLGDESAMPSRALLRPTPFGVDAGAVDRVARRMIAASRPCLVVGRGVAVARAEADLRRFAERWSVPVATTPSGKGCFDERNPLGLGAFGFGGADEADRWIFGGADLLLVLGSRLGELTTNHWDPRFAASATLVQVDVDARRMGVNYAPDEAIVADAGAFIRALDARLEALSYAHVAQVLVPTASGPRTETTCGAPSAPSALSPRDVVRAMRAELPDDARLCVDNGNAILWAGREWEVREPRTYFGSLGFGSMGTAVASVLGVKLAAPEQPAVALVGDAAFAMNGAEVHTAVEHGIGAIWVVLNNGGHGMVAQGERLIFGRDLGACHYRQPIDAAAFARSLGAGGVQVTTAAGLAEALRSALDHGGPTVIDAVVDRAEVPPALARRAAHVRAMSGR